MSSRMNSIVILLHKNVNIHNLLMREGYLKKHVLVVAVPWHPISLQRPHRRRHESAHESPAHMRESLAGNAHSCAFTAWSRCAVWQGTVDEKLVCVVDNCPLDQCAVQIRAIANDVVQEALIIVVVATTWVVPLAQTCHWLRLVAVCASVVVVVW